MAEERSRQLQQSLEVERQRNEALRRQAEQRELEIQRENIRRQREAVQLEAERQRAAAEESRRREQEREEERDRQNEQRRQEQEEARQRELDSLREQAARQRFAPVPVYVNPVVRPVIVTPIVPRLPPSAVVVLCNCNFLNAVPGMRVPDSRCASGVARVMVCNTICSSGRPAWAADCL